MWDVTDPTQPTQIGQPLRGHNGAVTSLAFTPDGRTLATSSYDHTVILWDVTDPTQPTQIGQPLIGRNDAVGHTDAVLSVAFTRDGHTQATGGNDNIVILWDTTGIDELRSSPAAKTRLLGHRWRSQPRAMGPLYPRSPLQKRLRDLRRFDREVAACVAGTRSWALACWWVPRQPSSPCRSDRHMTNQSTIILRAVPPVL